MPEFDNTEFRRRSREQPFDPWRRAEALSFPFVYWMPVDCFPLPQSQREWLMHFVDRLIGNLKEEGKLRVELFLQYKTLHPNLTKPFLKHAQELFPLIGLSRRPGATFSSPLTEGDIDDFVHGRRKFSFNEYVADYAYWFVNKSERKERELFFGYGGMSFLFMAADPNIKPPRTKISQAVREWHPVFKKFDVDSALASTAALADGFRAKSIALFGEGLEDDPQSDGLPFIIPLLTTKDLLQPNLPDVQKWFQLFQVYLNESPQDQGMLLASAKDLEHLLLGILSDMRDCNLRYEVGRT